MKYIGYLHTRDFRLYDNYTLNHCLDTAQQNQVIPLFIFNPRQITKENSYFSLKSYRFMVESLYELSQNYQRYGITLNLFIGYPEQVLKDLSFQKIYIGKEYTPFGKKRVELIKNNGIEVIEIDDFTLLPLNSLLTKNNTPYMVFSPFNNKVSKLMEDVKIDNSAIQNIKKLSNIKFNSSLSWSDILNDIQNYDKSLFLPGRTNAFKSLIKYFGYFDSGKNIIFPFSPQEKNITKKQISYAFDKDQLSIDTSLMSVHIKFGNISIRELYFYCPNNDLSVQEYKRQIIWHDYYASHMYWMPNNLILGGSNIYNISINWKINDINNPIFYAWCFGRTGVPIIDACMRQLYNSGWMHNRGRLIVSNFLIFYLGINWKLGEWWFATRLADFDPSSNNGGWQDNLKSKYGGAVVYNIQKQALDHDPDGSFIHKWIPELNNKNIKQLINLPVDGYIPLIISEEQMKNNINDIKSFF